jgi:hypothetical protein
MAGAVAAVESKSELVEIGIQMLLCRRPLVCAEQPTLELCSDAIHPPAW